MDCDIIPHVRGQSANIEVNETPEINFTKGKDSKGLVKIGDCGDLQEG